MCVNVFLFSFGSPLKGHSGTPALRECGAHTYDVIHMSLPLRPLCEGHTRHARTAV